MDKKTNHHIAVILVITLLGIIVIASGTFVFFNTYKSQPIISKQIIAEANFTIFYPPNNAKSPDEWRLQEERTTYNKESGVLTMYVLQPSTERQIVLNEQPVPGAFNDVPTQYSKMLTTLNEYNELQIGFGTVALTHPKELNGGQTAVANKAGTLIFAKPSADLSDDEWKSFFESLRILR